MDHLRYPNEFLMLSVSENVRKKSTTAKNGVFTFLDVSFREVFFDKIHEQTQKINLQHPVEKSETNFKQTKIFLEYLSFINNNEKKSHVFDLVRDKQIFSDFLID